MKRIFATIAASALTLSACNLVDVEYDDPKAQDNASEIAKDVPVRETKNVTYTGVVQPAGISVYNQGSHRLVLQGGKFVLLESDDLDLNGYVAEKVQIFGSLRPTVEAGGMIMRVESIELVDPKEEELKEILEELPVVDPDAQEPLEEESVEEESVEEESVEEPTEESLDPDEPNPIDLPEVPEVPEEPAEEEPPVEEIVEEIVSEEDPVVEPTGEPTAEYLERVEVMSRQDYAAANWTQQYCTSHISFCAPIHRNWWFKSFGATSSTLWHVELSPAPIENLGEGPIVVELIAGTIGDASGTVDTTSGEAVGYKEWTFGRYFRISGDTSLEEAITYITNNITEFAN